MTKWVSNDRRFQIDSLSAKPIKYVLPGSQTWIRVGFDSRQGHLVLKYEGTWTQRLPQFIHDEICRNKTVDASSVDIK